MLADGAVKSIGRWVIDQGISERWMPFTTGLLFLPLLLLAVGALQRIPPPSAEDVAWPPGVVAQRR